MSPASVWAPSRHPEIHQLLPKAPFIHASRRRYHAHFGDDLLAIRG